MNIISQLIMRDLSGGKFTHCRLSFRYSIEVVRFLNFLKIPHISLLTFHCLHRQNFCSKEVFTYLFLANISKMITTNIKKRHNRDYITNYSHMWHVTICHVVIHILYTCNPHTHTTNCTEPLIPFSKREQPLDNG